MYSFYPPRARKTLLTTTGLGGFLSLNAERELERGREVTVVVGRRRLRGVLHPRLPVLALEGERNEREQEALAKNAEKILDEAKTKDVIPVRLPGIRGFVGGLLGRLGL